MSARRNFNPVSEQFNNRQIVRGSKGFPKGAFDDIPGPSIPEGGIKYSENYLLFPDRGEPRGGTKRWSDTPLPSLPGRTGYTLSKYRTTVHKTAGAAFVAGDVGNYIVYDNGKVDLITAYLSADEVRVAGSDLRPDSTAAYVRGAKYGFFHHPVKNKLVLHIDTRFFWADINITAWTECTPGSSAVPAKSASSAAILGDKMVVFNENGIFSIDLSTSPYWFYKLNTPIARSITLPFDESFRSSANVYGYRYVYTLVRLGGTGQNRQRTDSGVTLDAESAPIAPDSSTFRDYCEKWEDMPVGAGEDKCALRRGPTALPGAFDTLTELAAVANGQFGISITGGASTNIQCIFTGITSWDEAAERIQAGLQDQFSSLLCAWRGSYFEIKDTDIDSQITSIAAGASGTDISGLFTGSGALSTQPFVDAPLNMTQNDVYCPGGADQFTHFGLYRTMDLGDNGIDPISGAANNTELYVWVADVPICKAVKVTVSGGVCNASEGEFRAADVGSAIYFNTGTTPKSLLITAYTSPASVIVQGEDVITETVGSIGTGFPAADREYGHNLVGSQSGTTLTLSVMSGYVGGTIFWADGTKSVIIALASDTSLTVYPAATFTDKAGCYSPTVRAFSDTISDAILRDRANGFSLSNRLWTSLPTDSRCGVIGSGFMITAQRDSGTVNYCQLPDGEEYLAGYNYDEKQFLRVNDNIRALHILGDMLIIFCSHSIVGVALNTFGEYTIPKINFAVITLSSQSVISDELGCHDYGSITKITKTRAIFRANDQTWRMISYDGAGVTISDNLAKDRIQKRLDKLVGITATCYDKINGLMVWGSNVKI